ncbi:uncharacterized protein CCOS01_08321 [Colletotrichum costaricense]|uniref:Uncharacterized protein n=1 Tax=Colletotrichum costaricense TaxID=1209916 RepID=A0AAI9YWA5_9PEZI|nr:uncharacterized protein CCOS01_08321 [Colletotrichum costaricense]KAK1525903.1 hypothetical protein CCOS01_08321 [Colletotrichum costaricense]
MVPVATSPPGLISMKSRVINKFYEPLVLLKAMNDEMTSLAEFFDPDDLNYRGDVKKIFQAFVYKLAHVCDSTPGNGGSTVTSIMLLRGSEGTNVEYHLASNQRCVDDLENVRAYLQHLLERVDRASTSGRTSELRKDLLNAVIWFNRPRINSYIVRLEIEIQRCIKNARNGWPLNLIDIEFFLLAKDNWPEIFRNFMILVHPSSHPLSRPRRNKSMTAEGIVGRMTRKEDIIERFRQFVQDLQIMHLDQRIQAEYQKDNFQPVVHSEILLLNHLEKSAGGVSPDRFFNNWMYIGSSKPTCRLCEYYFEEHRSGVGHRSSHKNLYISWRVPDVLQSEGHGGEEKRQVMVDRLLLRIRKDAFNLVEKRVRPTFRNHDSITSSVSMTLHGNWSEASDISDVMASMGSLQLNNDEGTHQDEPPSLPEVVPFISNTYQYMTNIRRLMERASNIVKFYLGPMRVYFVQGGESVQAMFRSSTSISSNKFILLVMRNLQGSAQKDVDKFANDLSGRQRVPAPGYENTPQEERYWYTLHHITVEHLSRAEPTAHLAETYTNFFNEALEKQPVGQWATVRLLEFLKKEMCASAIRSFCGTELLEMFPDYVEQFWRFDSIAFQVVYGLPKWINSGPVNERDKLNGMTQKYLRKAFAKFDWDGSAVDSIWEPTFGSSYVRKMTKWLHDTDMAPETQAGFYMIAIFGINANTIPITTWAMIELLRDQKLFQAVRSEALETLNVDPVTGKRSFNVSKLISMPLMQSIYTECMRLHVSIALSREVVETTTLHGFRLEKGSIIQAPTHFVHLDEQIWSQEGHSASEFWAERHLKHVKKVEEGTDRLTTEKQFVLAGKTNDFIPFGGGPSMCPGRFFAKQEILLTIAILVTKFDMEFVEWTNLDGSKSDRPPVDDERYFGTAAVPPDRDVKVRWKKLW